MLTDKNPELKKLLEKLKAESNSTVFVEGKKDASALKCLGVDFFILNKKNNGRSLYETAEMFANSNEKALLMFDTDKKGRQLSKLFKTYLQQNGVQVNAKLGDKILKAAKVRQVEDLQL